MHETVKSGYLSETTGDVPFYTVFLQCLEFFNEDGLLYTSRENKKGPLALIESGDNE